MANRKISLRATSVVPREWKSPACDKLTIDILIYSCYLMFRLLYQKRLKCGCLIGGCTSHWWKFPITMGPRLHQHLRRVEHHLCGVTQHIPFLKGNKSCGNTFLSNPIILPGFLIFPMGCIQTLYWNSRWFKTRHHLPAGPVGGKVNPMLFSIPIVHSWYPQRFVSSPFSMFVDVCWFYLLRWPTTNSMLD